MFKIHAVARLEYGMLDLASLVPNAGGFEPDPIKRIANSRVVLAIPPRAHLDLSNIFKPLPMEVRPPGMISGGLAAKYKEF